MISDTVPTWKAILELKSAGNAFKARLDAWVQAGEDAVIFSKIVWKKKKERRRRRSFFFVRTLAAVMETSAGHAQEMKRSEEKMLKKDPPELFRDPE